MKNYKSKTRKKRTLRQRISIFIMAFIVRLSFTRLTVTEKINMARRVVSMMTGNAYFPDPTPSLTDVANATDALEAAQSALPGTKAETQLRNLRAKELDKLMSDLQAYVEWVAKGDKQIVYSSGMDVREDRNPIGFLPPTESVTAKNLVEVGAIQLRWKKVKKSTGYRVELTTDPTHGWPMVYESEKASLLIQGLQPGMKYYIRVATLSHAGYFGYSETCTIRINLPLD